MREESSFSLYLFYKIYKDFSFLERCNYSSEAAFFPPLPWFRPNALSAPSHAAAGWAAGCRWRLRTQAPMVTSSPCISARCASGGMSGASARGFRTPPEDAPLAFRVAAIRLEAQGLHSKKDLAQARPAAEACSRGTQVRREAVAPHLVTPLA